MFSLIPKTGPEHDFEQLTHFWKKSLVQRDEALRLLEIKNRQVQQAVQIANVLNLQTKLLLVIAASNDDSHMLSIVECMKDLSLQLNALLDITE